jgi:hypothetical protein
MSFSRSVAAVLFLIYGVPGWALPPMPSLQDEKDTYQKWGWTWAPGVEPSAVTEPVVSYAIADPDIHGDTEGDDLWTYLMMYQRTGNPVYLNRANAWARYFKEDYRACVGGSGASFCYDRDSFGADHLYGWGLIALYEINGDTAALTEAVQLGVLLESLYAPSSPFGCLPSSGCIHYGLRQIGRHLLFATRLAEVTGDARWVVLRDKIIDLVVSSPEWDGARGMYFLGDWSTDQIMSAGAYAAGARIQSPFMLGVFVEGLYDAYRVTRRADLRDRLVAMARFVDQYGLDPVYHYAGSEFGVVDGKVWHNYAQSSPVTFWDPVYTTALVNVLVYGYKLTGDSRLLDRARYFFNRGSKGIYGEPVLRNGTETTVHHFVDTVFDTSTMNYFLAYNKGELFYTHALFENGGSPTVENGAGVSAPPAAPRGLRRR